MSQGGLLRLASCIALSLLAGCVGPANVDIGNFTIPFAQDLKMCEPGDGLSSGMPMSSTYPSGDTAIDAVESFGGDLTGLDLTGIQWNSTASKEFESRSVVVGDRGGPILVAALVVDLGLDNWAVEDWANCEALTIPTSTAQVGTTTSHPAQFSATRTPIALGWEALELPAIVASCHQAVIPTAEEIVFWGGNQSSCEYESAVGNPGLAYNPDTGTWRQLSAGPLQPAVSPTGVWSGSEVLICCGIEGVGSGGSEVGSNQAAAYDPEADSWRTIPDAPLDGPFPVSVWTGSEMLVATQAGVAAYDPSADEWRTLPAPPEPLGRTNEIAWTGSEAIVWPSTVTRSVFQGMAVNPKTGTWRVLPDPPAWPAALDMVSTGDSLIIWGGLPAERGSERAVGSRLNLETNEWFELPEAFPEPDGCECNLGSQALTWTGEYVLVSTGFFSSGLNDAGSMLIAYHPETNEWIMVDDASPLGHGGEGLMVGDRLAITENPITQIHRLFISPAGWQPTGDPIPAS